MRKKGKEGNKMRKWLSLISLFLLPPILSSAQNTYNNYRVEYKAKSNGHEGQAYWECDKDRITFSGKIGKKMLMFGREEKFKLTSIDDLFIININGKADTLVKHGCSDLLRIIETELNISKGLQNRKSEYKIITNERKKAIEAEYSRRNGEGVIEIRPKEKEGYLVESLGGLNKIEIYTGASTDLYNIPIGIFLTGYNKKKNKEEKIAEFSFFGYDSSK